QSKLAVVVSVVKSTRSRWQSPKRSSLVHLTSVVHSRKLSFSGVTHAKKSARNTVCVQLVSANNTQSVNILRRFTPNTSRSGGVFGILVTCLWKLSLPVFAPTIV